MKVIVYYPKTEEGIRELQRKVSQVHSEAVERYLINLPYPKEQRLKLLESVIEDLEKEKLHK